MAERTPIEITRGDGTSEIVIATLIDGLTLEEVTKADQSWEGPFFDLASKYARAGIGASDLPPSWV